MEKTMPELPDSVRGAPAFVQVHQRREENASRARQAQADYKLMISFFIVATAVAAVMGGLVLYGADSLPTAPGAASSGTLKDLVTSEPARWLLPSLQAAAVLVAGYSAFRLNHEDFAAVWRESRDKAEAGRCERARVALRVAHQQGQEPFRATGRWLTDDLIDKQIKYMTEAIDKHEGRSRWLGVVTAVILAAAAAGPILMTIGVSALIVVAALFAVVTPALLSGLKSWGEANGSAERAKLHRATRDLLRDIGGRQSEFDAAIEAADLTAAERFLDEVCAALRTDVEGFLKIAGQAPKPPPPAAPSQLV
jgi:hypothetical protein